MQRLHFNGDELQLVSRAVSVSEDLVSDHYKISESQWLRNRYDVKTGVHLTPHEHAHRGVFAHLICYSGSPSPNAGAPREFDLYMICLQDHTILHEVETNDEVLLYPFLMYLFVHELIHIVRFGRFIQRFSMPIAEREHEENIVHKQTRKILATTHLTGIEKIIVQRWAIRHCNQ